MSDKQRLILGGLGALLPIVISLLQFDYQNTSKIIADTGWVGGLGYLFRLGLLFGLGAFFAYVHQDEHNRWKIIQLGIGAPALAISLYTGHIAETKPPPNPSCGNTAALTKNGADGQSWKTGVFMLLSEVEAATPENTDGDLKDFTLKEQTVLSKLWRGFTGTPRSHVWFVIADTAPTAKEARQKAEEINRKVGSNRAEVYRPYLEGQDYSVVVGRDLDLDDAQELAEKVNKMTGTTKARVWSPPKTQQ